MVDTVFRVEVGAKYDVSTQRLKNDIQSILNNISQTPPTVTIGLEKEATKRQINHDLNDLFKNNGKAQYGVTLGLLGGGNIRGSSGKAITKDLLAITSTLSQQKAAKVTVHIDTQATQKAMMAELKKLNLAVTITGGNSNSTNTPQATQDQKEYNAALQKAVRLRAEEFNLRKQAETLDRSSKQYAETNRQANEKEKAFYAERDKYLKSAGATRLGVTQTGFNDAVSNARRVEAAYEANARAAAKWQDMEAKAADTAQKRQAKAAQQSVQVQQALLKESADIQKQIYTSQKEQAKYERGSDQYNQIQSTIDSKKRELAQKALQASSQFGIPASQFMQEVKGFDSVRNAAEKYTIALQNNADARDKSIDTQIDSAIGRLNEQHPDYQKWKQDFENLRKTLKTTGASAADTKKEVADLANQTDKAGVMAETAGQKFSRMLGEKIGYAAIALLINQVKNGLRQIYTNVVELDTGMTELKKVTDETDETYQKFLDGAASRAKTLGSTMSNVVNATASFARLGYSLDEATELADAAVVYAHVGDEVESIDEASNSVISTMQAFGVEAKDVMSIVDKFNTIGNRFAISSGGAGEAMQRSAAAMQAAGNTIDETLALIASMNTVLQNPESVGTTLKTLSMYLRASKTEAEAAGESTDGMADSVSKLREEIKSLTGNKVDIMADDNTYKSSFQILKELSQVWDQLTDVSQANILEKLAGKRNANAVSALLTNFDIAEKALLESQNAAGSAMAENEKYLDSINGKLDQLKASWEQLSASVLDSEVVKGAIDLIRGLIEIFNKLDEATGGVSSSIVLIVVAVTVVNSVLTAFNSKTKEATNLLGLFFQLLRTETRSNAMANLGEKFAKGGLLGIVKSFIGPGTKAIAILSGIAACIWVVKTVADKFRATNLPLEDVQEQSSELQSEVDELSASIETANERIKELESLANGGTISLTEQDELNRLKTQNELLNTQLALKKALLEQSQQEERQKAQEEYTDFFKGQGTRSMQQILNDSGDEALKYETTVVNDSPIQKFEQLRREIIEIDEQIKQKQGELATASLADAAKIDEAITKLQTERAEKLGQVSDVIEPLNDILTSLDPAEDAGMVKQIKNVIYQVQMLSGDATALKSVFDDFWSDTASHPGIDKMREKLEKAATAQRKYNEELKKYGGNVDLTNRPHVEVTQDMVDNYGGLWRQEDVGSYSTVDSITFTAKDLGLEGTQSVLVTPILPDGSILGSYEDIQKYLTDIFKTGGKIDANLDDQGIILGVFDEGSEEASIQKAGKVAEAVHNVNAAFHDMLETDTWKDFEAVLASVGLQVDDFTSGELAAMFETWTETADETTSSLSAVASELDTLTEKYDLLKSTQDEMNSSGTISASTLSSIVEKFPELADDVALYIAGMKTGKELIKDLSGAYQTDVDSYKDSLKKKLAASPEFYNSLTSQQKQLIDDLADSYDVDLGNFKTVEQAKLNFQAEIIKKLALNYQRYSGASLEQLKEYRATLRQAISNAQSNPGMYSDSFVSSRQAELKEVESAITAIEDSSTRLDGLLNGGLEGWDPSKYTDKSSSSSSDTYKTSVQEKINALKHQLQMEKITAEQYYNGLEAIENQYYKDSAAHLKKYADEIRSIDEELFDGRRELNEDWLNDQQDFAERAGAGGDYTSQQDYYDSMYSKLQEMIKAAKAYGLDESSDYVQELYDKVDQLQSDILASVKASFEDFESYMDDFDLWKGSDFSKLDYLQYRLKQIIALYDKGQLSWTQYTEARNEIAKKMYDTQRDSLEEILDLTMDMIKAEAEDQVDALDKQIDAYSKIIDKKKELLQDSADEADHEEQVAEKVKEIAELQSKIAQLSLDDSREATAKKASLEQDLYTAQKELADLQRDYSLDQTLEALDKSQEAFEDEKDAEKDAVEESVDSWQKLYEKAIARIEGDWSQLYKDLTRYEASHRDSIDGPDSLVTAWKNATSAMQEYNNSFEDAYNNIGDLSINPNSNQSSEAQVILQKMQANSALANSLGKSTTPDGRNLHKENEALAQEYYELTGQKLVYNNGWRLDNANGNLAYNHSSSTTKTNTTQTTTSKKDTSSTGSAYEATKAKFGSAPTGNPNLKVTSTGSDVKKLQYFLKEANFLDSSVAVDGQFWSRTEDAVKALQRDIKKRFDSSLVVDGVFGPATAKYLPKYHTGGIVGNAGSINDTEVLALLKKGEWVLDDQRKQNLKSLFSGLKEAASGMMSATVRNRMLAMRPAAAVTGGDTFAPHIEVSIQHNGSMSDKDAKQYGNMVANTALEQLKSAFAKRGKF